MDIQNADYFDARYYTSKTQFDMSATSSVSQTGTGASASQNAGLAGYLTYKRASTGSTSSGAAGFRYEEFLPGGGAIILKIGARVATLSTVSQEYIAEIGWHDGNATSSINDGAFFRYDRLTSANWICVTEDGGTETTTDSGIAVGTDVTHLKIVFNDDNTSTAFYINGTLGATHTTNITSAIDVWISYRIVKSAGTTFRTLDGFYYQYIQKRT